MEKRWEVYPEVSADLKQQLLINRGLTNEYSQKKFIHPHLNQFTLLDQLFPDIDKAIARIVKAIKQKELIFVYGDYDVDGITGAAILWETINYLGGKVLPYIPSRQNEGYGLHSEALQELLNQGAKLVISVDCGITALEQAKLAKAIGLDLIITDHHTPSETFPEPFSLIHTTSLSGSGVAFKLAEGLLIAFNKNTDEQYFKNLELAALGTIADMVPLLSDNRIIVKNGLKILSNTQRIGLKALYHEAEIGKKIGTYEVGFIISPRLNCMGRMESALDSLRLLLTRDETRANNLALILSKTNKERQEITISSYEDAKNMVEKKYLGSKFLVIDSQRFPEGIVGLVASRIAEFFYRPTAVIGQGKKYYKGSARSINGFNITEAIRTQSDLLISHGGHPMAAGFSIEKQNIEAFRNNLEKLAVEQINDIDLSPILKIDTSLKIDDLNNDLVELLNSFEPFGVKNPDPNFLTENLKVVTVKSIGAGQKHIRLTLVDEKSNRIEGIGFNLSHKKPQLGDQIDIVYNLKENYWNSRRQIEARIKDLRQSSSRETSGQTIL